MDSSPAGNGAPASLHRRLLLVAGAGLALAASCPRAQTARGITFFVANNIFGTSVYIAAENGYVADLPPLPATLAACKGELPS